MREKGSISHIRDDHRLLFHFLDVLNPEECDEVLRESKNLNKSPGKVRSMGVGTELREDIRICDTQLIPETTMNPVLVEFQERLDSCVRYANTSMFNMDVGIPKEGRRKYHPEKGGGVVIMTYGVGGMFDLHQDWGCWNLFSHRRLTIVIQMTDPKEYDGGNLIIHSSDKWKAPLTQGSAVVFPSFWYHKVTPIERGLRQCIVGWYVGENPML